MIAAQKIIIVSNLAMAVYHVIAELLQIAHNVMTILGNVLVNRE